MWNCSNLLCAISHFPVCTSDEECVFVQKDAHSESDKQTTKGHDKDLVSCVSHDVREPESWSISRKVPFFLTLKRNMQFSKETFYTNWTCAKEMFHSKMKFNLLIPISVILTLPTLKIDVRKDPCNRIVRPQMFGNWRNTSIGTKEMLKPMMYSLFGGLASTSTILRKSEKDLLRCILGRLRTCSKIWT